MLQNLVQLQTLWMNENRLSQIEGLQPLQQLTTLWLARNPISSICNSLDGNGALTALNLAATAIGSFKDIPQLTRLTQLRTMAFGDMHYGESPVCALCNYQTYVLYHLQQLATLDNVAIAEESRQLAEAAQWAGSGPYWPAHWKRPLLASPLEAAPTGPTAPTAPTAPTGPTGPTGLCLVPQLYPSRGRSTLHSGYVEPPSGRA